MADNYLESKFEEYRARKSMGTVSRKRKPFLHKTRRVLVMRGADGIGKAVVWTFRSAGHRVAFCDTDEAKGRETALQTGTRFCHVDAGDVAALEDCMRQLIADWGDIDIVINTTGPCDCSSVTETGVEDFDRVLSLDLRPVFVTARTLAVHRRSLETPNPFGRIVNVCSTDALMTGPGREGYAAAAGGICSLTRALAFSLSACNITVNSVTSSLMGPGAGNRTYPVPSVTFPSREGKPEDVARICLFLCQDENDFINGENIRVDGGQSNVLYGSAQPLP